MADPKIATKKPEIYPNLTKVSTPNTSKKPPVENDSKDAGIFTTSTNLTTNSAPEAKTSGSPVPTDTFSIFATGAAKDARSRAVITAERTAGIYDAYAGASSLPSEFPVSTATSTAQSKVYLNNAQAMAGEAKSWMDQAANCYASDPTKAKALYEKAEKRLLEAQKMLKNAEAEGATLQDLAQTSQDVYHFLYQCRQNNVSGYDINASLDGTAETTGFWQNVANSLPSILPNLIQGLMGGSGKTDSSGNTTRTNQTPSSGSSSGSTSSSGASSKELKVPAGYENLPDVVKAKGNHSESQGRIDEATGAIAVAKGDLGAAEAQKEALEDEIKALDGESEKAAEEYMDLKSKQATHIQEQKKYEQIQTQKNELAKVYGQQIDAKKGELPRAKADVVSKNNALQIAKDDVSKAEGEVTGAQKDLATARTELEAAKAMPKSPENDSKVAAARNAVIEAEQKLREKEAALEKAKAEKVQAEKNLKIAENKVAKINDEIKVLTEHKEKANTEATEAGQKASAAKTKAEGMNTDIEAAGKLIESIKIEEKDLKTSIDKCFNDINTAQATIDTNSTIIDCEKDKQDAAQDLADVAVQRAQKDKYTQEGGLINGIVAWW